MTEKELTEILDEITSDLVDLLNQKMVEWEKKGMNFGEIINLATNVGIAFAARTVGGSAFNMGDVDSIERIVEMVLKRMVKEAHDTYNSMKDQHGEPESIGSAQTLQ